MRKKLYSRNVLRDVRYMIEVNEKPLERLVGGYSYTSIFRKIAFVGDSLSSGEFEAKDTKGKIFHDLYEYSWGQFIARRNGLEAYNFSRGGMTTKEYIKSFAENNGFWDKDKACQAYVIALGINDLYHCGMELGSIKDIDKKDYRNNGKTFAGYYAQIISRYKEISPDAKFFLVTLPNNDGRKDFKELIENMIKLLSDFSNYFSNTYVIDIYNYADVQNDEFRENYNLGGHMNPMGYIYAAEIIDSYIDYIIRNNPSDFKHVGLINSGIDYVDKF